MNEAGLHPPTLLAFILKWPNHEVPPATGTAWVWVTSTREAEMRAGSAILGKPEYSTLPRLDIPAANTPSRYHSQSSRAQENTSRTKTTIFGKQNHVFQQRLKHFKPSSSRGLHFGSREMLERLACWDGPTQHRGTWPTLTTNKNNGKRCGSTSWPHQAMGTPTTLSQNTNGEETKQG